MKRAPLAIALALAAPFLAGAGADELPELAPLPDAPQLDKERVEIGRMLFVSTALSKNDNVSCLSCHSLETGTISVARGTGTDGELTPYNPPSLFNAAYNFRQRWTGRDETLPEMIESVLRDASVMGSSPEHLVGAIMRDVQLRAAMETEYGDVSFANAVDALAEYTRSLARNNAPFDQYLRGTLNKMDAAVLEGARRFVVLGCVSCHQGRGIGGNMYAPFGPIIGQLDDGKARERGHPDLGRYNITGLEEDKGLFRVPPLWNVALTGPYFHDGRAESLDDAIRQMGEAQLGRKLDDVDVRFIRAFLESLTGVPHS